MVGDAPVDRQGRLDAVAIQHGLVAVLVICGAIIVATFFLKDVPMTQQSSEASDEVGTVAESGEDLSIIP